MNLRDLTAKCMFEAIESLAARGSLWVNPQEIARIQTREQRFDIAIDIANVLLERLSSPPQPANKQDKTRRSLNKQVQPRKYRLRGAPTERELSKETRVELKVLP